MTTRLPIIGLTGGIGSGKSTVARLLEELGCVVSNSDADGRAALTDPLIHETIVTWWGPGVLNETGAVDRTAVAEIVFNDLSERRRLEGLTHPWIEARRVERFAAAPPDATALVIDAPLLIEAGLHRQCDAVIFVDASLETRLTRLVTTRAWSDAELRRREDSQLPLDVKRSKADYVLRNEDDLTALSTQVRATLETIRRRFSSASRQDGD